MIEINVRIQADKDTEFTPMEAAVLAALSGEAVAKTTGEIVVNVSEVQSEEVLAAAAAKAKPAPKARPKPAAKPAPKAAESEPETAPEATTTAPSSESEAVDPVAEDPSTEQAGADEDDDVLGGDEPAESLYDAALARATELAAKGKQAQIKAAMKKVGGFGKVREMADADNTVLQEFLDELKAL